MSTLITGCSFVDHVYNYKNRPNWPVDHEKFVIRGRPGAGNTAIAANTIWHLASGNYTDLIVLWSGIRRLDVPVSAEYHNYLKKLENTFKPWHWVTETGPTVWYNSGGQAGLWTMMSTCPASIKQIIETQYKDTSLAHLSNLTFLAIASIQNFCQVKNIPYKMGFIYDIHADNSCNEHAHGKIDASGPLYNVVDWSKIHTSTNAYQWCRDRNMISDDMYHPTPMGIIEYFKQAFDTNIAR